MLSQKRLYKALVKVYYFIEQLLKAIMKHLSIVNQENLQRQFISKGFNTNIKILLQNILK